MFDTVHPVFLIQVVLCNPLLLEDYVTPRPLIVCIEDNEQHLRLRKAVLEKSGYDVIGVTTAHDALTVLRRVPGLPCAFRSHVARYNRRGASQQAQEDKNGRTYRGPLWYHSRDHETCGWLREQRPLHHGIPRVHP